MSHSLFTTTKPIATKQKEAVNALCDKDSLVQVSNITFAELQTAIIGSTSYTKSGDEYTQPNCPTCLRENLITNGESLESNGINPIILDNLDELFALAEERGTYIYIY